MPETADALQAAQVPAKPIVRMANFRVSQNEFRMGKLSAKFAQLMVSEIIAMTQTESDGNISFTICYR